MKKLLIILLIACAGYAQAQVLHPVKWAYGAKKTSRNEAVVFIKATNDDGWHIYSACQKEGGPVKTSFEFSPAADHELLGAITEPAPVSRFEKAFGMNVDYFEHEVIFRQRIRLNSSPALIAGSLSFMCCNDQKCLAPEIVNFSIPVK